MKRYSNTLSSMTKNYSQDKEPIVSEKYHCDKCEDEKITCIVMDESKTSETQTGSSENLFQNEQHIAYENPIHYDDTLKSIEEMCETTWFTYLSKLNISQDKNVNSCFTGNQAIDENRMHKAVENQKISSSLNDFEMQQIETNAVDLDQKSCVKEKKLTKYKENRESFLCHHHQSNTSSLKNSIMIDENGISNICKSNKSSGPPFSSYISSSKSDSHNSYKSWKLSQRRFDSTFIKKISTKSDPRLNSLKKKNSDISQEIPLKRVKWDEIPNTKLPYYSKDFKQKNINRSSSCPDPTRTNDKTTSASSRPTDPRLQHSQIFFRNINTDNLKPDFSFQKTISISSLGEFPNLQSSSLGKYTKCTWNEDSTIVPKKINFCDILSSSNICDKYEYSSETNLNNYRSAEKLGHSLCYKSPITFKRQNSAALSNGQFDGIVHTAEKISNCDIKSNYWSSTFKNQSNRINMSHQELKFNFMSDALLKEPKTNEIDSSKNQMSGINNKCTFSQKSRLRSKWDSPSKKHNHEKNSMTKPLKVSEFRSRWDSPFEKQNHEKSILKKPFIVSVSRWDSPSKKHNHEKNNMTKPLKVSEFRSRWNSPFEKQNHKKSILKKPFIVSVSRWDSPFKKQNCIKNICVPFSVADSTNVMKGMEKDHLPSHNNQHRLSSSTISANKKALEKRKSNVRRKNNSLNKEILNLNVNNKKVIKTCKLETSKLKRSGSKIFSSEFMQTKRGRVTPSESISVKCNKNSKDVKKQSATSHIFSKNFNAKSVCIKPSLTNISLKGECIPKYNNFEDNYMNYQKSKPELKISNGLFEKNFELKSSIQKDILPKAISHIQTSDTQKNHSETLLKLYFLNKTIAKNINNYKQSKTTYCWLKPFKTILKMSSRLNWKYYINFISSNILALEKLTSPTPFTSICKKLKQNPFLRHLIRHSNCGLNGDLKVIFLKLFKLCNSKFLIQEKEIKACRLLEDTSCGSFSFNSNTVAKSVTTLTEKSFDLGILKSMECSSEQITSVCSHSNIHEENNESDIVLLYDNLLSNKIFHNLGNECFVTLTSKLSLIWKDFLKFTKLGFDFDSEFLKEEDFIDLLRRKGISFPNLNCLIFLNPFLLQKNGLISCKNWLTDILFNSKRKYLFSLNIKFEHSKIINFKLAHVSEVNIDSLSSYYMSSVKDKSYDHQYKMTDVIKHAEIELSSAIRRSKSCITDIVNSNTEEKYEILNTQSNGLCEQFIHSKKFSSKLPISNFDIEKIETEEYGCTKSLSNTVLQPVSCANNFQLCSISTKGVLNVFEKNEDISSELYIPINNIEMKKIESEECKCAKLLNTDLQSPNCADNFQLCSILTDEVLNVFEKNEIFTISEQLNIYKPNSNESKIVYNGSDGKSTVSSHKENRHSYCDITQKKNNSAPENYSEKKISNKQSSDSSFRKTLSCIFTSNCTLQKEKAVSCFQIDTLFQDIDLFKQGGVLFHYYEHLKATGDHALNLNDINEDMSNLNGEVLESYIFLKNQLNYHKDVLRGLVHLSSEPGTCFKSNLIHDIVLQLDYIEGYDLACKAILL